LAILAIRRDPKKLGKEKKTNKYQRPAKKMCLSGILIQNLDVVALELVMKVQFANF
jgi:hypothetical protein